MTSEVVAKPSEYRGGGVDVSLASEPGAVLWWASCYVTDDIEVSVPDLRCTRADLVQLQALLARALVEYDTLNGPQ